MTSFAAKRPLRGLPEGWLRRLTAARESVRRVPRAAFVCAAVAVLNSAAWAILLPPLQAHDEPAHVYYVQYLAETGKIPRPVSGGGTSFTQEEQALVDGLHLFDVIGNRQGRPPWSDAQRDALHKTLSGPLSRVSSRGGDEGVGAYPPLYYAVGALAYKAVGGRTLVTRITAIRLMTALLCGVTVLFVFMFLRELLPRQRWVWPVGALATAFEPVFAYISGAVNPDAAIAAASAALFYLLARSFRRGITPAVGAWIGLVLALGILAKITMVAFVPGAALALVILVLRGYRRGNPRQLGALVAAALTFALPVALYCLLNVTVWDRPLLPGGSVSAGEGVSGVVTGATGVGAGSQVSLSGFLSYAWQDYLPRLPFMTPWFTGYQGWDVWFKSFWGIFGWRVAPGDYSFSEQAFTWLLYASIFIMAGVLVAVARARRALRSRLGELVSYAALVVGLLTVLAYVGYGLRTSGNTGLFEQGRYLFPLLAPFAALIAVGAIGFGDRVGRYVGVLVVVGSFGLTFYAHLLTVARFYA
jgi:4-amino-4-deoxy-L-arabinose transferase-like glycosyltransferase